MKNKSKVNEIFYNIRHNETYPYTEAKQALLQELLRKLPEKKLTKWHLEKEFNLGYNQAIQEVQEILKGVLGCNKQ